MNLSESIYCPLKDEEQSLVGWNKSTVEYARDNKDKLISMIRGMTASSRKLIQPGDVQDIYMELMQYLYKSDDYNISKAYFNSSNPGMIVSLGGYIASCLKNTVRRYIHDKYRVDSNEIKDRVISKEGGKELLLFDTISDTRTENSFEKLEYDLDVLCEQYQSLRYEYGVDLYLIWYIKLRKANNECKNDKDILEVIGIKKKDIQRINNEIREEGPIYSIARAISITGVNNAIDIIRKYVYGADNIDKIMDIK